MPATRQEAEDFLARFRLTIDFNQCQFKGRARTQQDLIDLEITPQIALDIIKKLTADNYSSGPKPDDTDHTKDVWVFGYCLENREVYIKLRINPVRSRGIDRGLVWSFHEAEYKMRYPLREEE